MTTTITRFIPAVTEGGLLLDIPRSAWADVEKVANEEFSAYISVHFHNGPGEYEGGPLIPFSHYLIEATLDRNLSEAFIDRIDPIINDVIERHTQLPVLAGR